MKKNFTIIIVAIAMALCSSNLLVAQESTGDLYEGMTRKVTYNQMIPPYGIEVSYYKTVHIIFPAPIAYVDLGTNDILAGKADGAENVLRVKSALDGFNTETNFSVITNEGSFYSFNVKYANEPVKLNIEMKDFLHEYSEGNVPNNQLDIYLKELGNESPTLVRLVMGSIHKENKRHIKHIGSRLFGVQLLLKGIYTYNDMIYFHIQVANKSNMNFDVDFIRFKIVDKKVAKRTAMQETIIYPMRAYNNVTAVGGKKTERAVYAVKRFTIPDDKLLVIELYEKNGGRHQTMYVENSDITGAEINELKAK